MQNKIVYIVHCVDTEGPLYESLSATGGRLKKTFDLKYDMSSDLLKQLQCGEGMPLHLREAVMDFLSKDRLSYKTDWNQVNEMVDELMSSEWRSLYEDDFGQGYAFSWFILDHVGFKINPRRRALGYHVVFENYLEKLEMFKPSLDCLYWHFHPVSFFYEAHKTSNNLSFTNEHIQIINRLIIDYAFFPSAFRPGCHTERPDINLFLELWVPFDYGNQGMYERTEDAMQKDIGGGRYGDWRRATSDWEVYHPDFYDYQKKGGMKRYISRCLNLGSRLRPINEAEIEKAFIRANGGNSTILAVTNHDEREMRADIDWFMTIVRKVRRKYSAVRIMHANAVDGVRLSENLKFEPPTKLEFNWADNRLDVTADKDIWGPQPWLCFKTKDKRYIHENFDFQGGAHWSFVFDDDTIRLGQIEAIGVATNDNFGNGSVYRISPDKDLSKLEKRFLNTPRHTS